jgi:hypothetical protein
LYFQISITNTTLMIEMPPTATDSERWVSDTAQTMAAKTRDIREAGFLMHAAH